ncbi:hypothetical protein L227DRAFT_578586 [Lentinus tigrinus ALCF2SS1-6]|uniref:F-box domain-containing protein n=2 Tax=Lentinus tigrinus TaxID=5365 RepID=A0A5C2S016_9APHY|nr:hypothetical protein L227DRAFT_578586 [Lentinus tigrinus ALCF2SS1-6]
MADPRASDVRVPIDSDILHMILEEAELETHKACSLVCHKWLDISRKFIFDLVVVRPAIPFDDFRLFLAAHRHVGVHVRDLHIHGSDDYNHPDGDLPPRRVDSWTLVEAAKSMPNVSSIQLRTVILVDAPDEAMTGVASLVGPIKLAKFSMLRCPYGYDHASASIENLFYLFEAETMQIDLRNSRAPWGPASNPHDATLNTPRWPIRHKHICLKAILDAVQTPFVFLTTFLVPGSLRRLHLAFYHWSHLDEMARFLQHSGESITEFTISFAHALTRYSANHKPSDEEWRAYNFSSLRNLSKLRFNLGSPLASHVADRPRLWTDTIGIPKFLACFPSDLPLHDGVAIDSWYRTRAFAKQSLRYVTPRPEIEGALFRFDNLERVTLYSWSTCNDAEEIGAEAFPRLWKAKKLHFMHEVKECC